MTVLTALILVMAAVPQAVVAVAPGNHDPGRCSLRGADGSFQYLLPPSKAHWFGTDALGCDVFVRTVFGARISLGIALGAVGVATVMGSVLGGVAGSAAGWLDSLLTRSVEICAGLPPVVMAVLILSTREGKRPLWLVALVLGLIAMPSTAKLVRTAVRELMVREYVEAARAGGASEARVLLRHVCPNAVTPVVVYAFLSIGPAIAAETTLAFLGLSVDPPAAGWGLLMAEGRARLGDHPSLLLFPAAFLVVTSLTFVLLGDRVEHHLARR